MKLERDNAAPASRVLAGPAGSSHVSAWLFAIVVYCTLIASIWLVRVPFYQEPDELAHVDYIFTLFDVGHPFRVAETHPAGEVAPQTRHIARAIDYRGMRYNPYARAPADYGTAAFFRGLDAGAPAPSGRAPSAGAALPYLMYSYPPAYYVLEAAVLSATYRLSASLSDGFFAMRALNVFLLAGTLVLSFFSFRAYGMTERLSLAAVFAIGAFPLVSRIFAYVQPDNATTFLVAVVVFAIARSRHERSSRCDVLATGALALLFLVKPPYAFAAWLATVPFLSVRYGGRSASPAFRIGMLLFPLLVFAVSNRYLSPINGGIESPLRWVDRTSAMMPAATATGSKIFRLAVDAVGECLSGSVFYGFWFTFGFRGGRFFSERALGPIFQAVTILGVASFLMAERILWRRISIVARTHGRIAIRLALTNHPVNLYLITTAMLVLAHVLSGGALELEGRYWCAMLLPLAIVTLRTLPRPLPRATRQIVAAVLAGTMATYSLVTSVVAVRAMNADFYGLRTAHHESVADILELRSAGGTSNKPHLLNLERPQPVRISGYAIDMITGFAAKHVYVEVDGATRIKAQSVGLPYPEVAQIFNDDRVAATKFVIDVPATALAVGRNELRFFVGDGLGTGGIPFWEDAWIVVASSAH